MSKEKKSLIIIGDSAFAEIAYEYFSYDSEYEVVGFSVESNYITKQTLFGLPVVAFENVADTFEPEKHEAFVAITYTQLNRVRTRLCNELKIKGYKLASYVSSKAFVWQNVKIGEHCFILEGNVVQPFAQLGNNIILWSGSHIAHHSSIRDNCFISCHVAIAGFVEIGENCFLGVNSTVSNNIKIAKDCWIGPNICVMKDTKAGEIYRNEGAPPAKVTSYRFFKIKE